MKTTKVYHAPGYPIDPAKEEKRAFENLDKYSRVLTDHTLAEFEKTLGSMLAGAHFFGPFYEDSNPK